jgi:hypothetical protein
MVHFILYLPRDVVHKCVMQYINVHDILIKLPGLVYNETVINYPTPWLILVTPIKLIHTYTKPPLTLIYTVK